MERSPAQARSCGAFASSGAIVRSVRPIGARCAERWPGLALLCGALPEFLDVPRSIDPSGVGQPLRRAVENSGKRSTRSPRVGQTLHTITGGGHTPAVRGRPEVTSARGWARVPDVPGRPWTSTRCCRRCHTSARIVWVRVGVECSTDLVRCGEVSRLASKRRPFACQGGVSPSPLHQRGAAVPATHSRFLNASR